MKMNQGVLAALLTLMVTAASGQTHVHHGAPAQQAPNQGKQTGANQPSGQGEQQPNAGRQGMQMQMLSLQDLVRREPSNVLPELGASQHDSGPHYSLEQLEAIALKNNPTLNMAQAEVRAARGRRTQAGLWPNPTVGYSGEEIRGGVFRGGQHGFFLEQEFVLGGKLGLGRRVAEQEIKLSEIEAEEQNLRVRNAVKLAYYDVLAAQELGAVTAAFVTLANQNAATARRLRNIGGTADTEVIQAEIAVKQSEIAAQRQRTQQRRAWRSLAAVVGQPTLEMGVVAGRLDAPAMLDAEQLVIKLVNEGPAVRIAKANVSRLEATFSRAQRERVPNLRVQAGAMQNRELLESRRPVGWQGTAQVGVQIPIFNRNQGNVEAAQAGLERARQDLQRVQFVLRERAAATVQAHEDAHFTVQQYEKEILPRAREVYALQVKAWGQMSVSYPVVLRAQEDLFALQTEYIRGLRALNSSTVALQGFLLTDGLEAPARPGEVDMPVREINLPVTRGQGGQE